MVQSWCCCRRVVLTLLVLWVTTTTALALLSGGRGYHENEVLPTLGEHINDGGEVKPTAGETGFDADSTQLHVEDEKSPEKEESGFLDEGALLAAGAFISAGGTLLLDGQKNPPADNGLHPTVSEKDFSLEDPSVVQKLEKSLLGMLGMESRPRVKSPSVPPYMLEMYRRHAGRLKKAQQKEAESSTVFPFLTGAAARTIRSFVHKESSSDLLYPYDRMRFHFNVSNIPIDEKLHTAELRLIHSKHTLAPALSQNVDSKISKARQNRRSRRRRWTEDDIPYVHRIMVYDILRRATKYSEPTLRLMDTKVIDARVEGVQELDVFDAVSRWMIEPMNNFGLLVHVIPLKETPKSVNASHLHLRKYTELNWHEKQPLLVVETKESEEKTRIRRSAAVKPRKTKNYCKRYPLYVDFRKVGWDDWIMAPPGYDAWFCKGDCPFPLSEEMNATNHAVVQTMVNSRYPDRVPKACCVPTELSAISMLYVDDGERFVLKNHQDMVVEGCGCR